MLSEHLLVLLQIRKHTDIAITFISVNLSNYRRDWVGRVVKALDLSSNGQMSAWVRTPHPVFFVILFLVYILLKLMLFILLQLFLLFILLKIILFILLQSINNAFVLRMLVIK